MAVVERVGLGLLMGKQWARSISVVPGQRVQKREELPWVDLRGRLTEISGLGNSSVLTLASLLVLEAQMRGEPVAWITNRDTSFYPPDMAEMGVDLRALPVIRCPDGRSMARAADRLARTGAFGLLSVDLGARGDVPLPLQTRLAGLARGHDMAIVFLTEKTQEAPSLSSLISLRVGATRRSSDEVKFSCYFTALKDKRFGPGWVKEVVCHGPPGLC
jgi:recombination protein RecA